MARTSISVDEATLLELHRLALERRTSLAAIVREALQEKLASARRKPRSLGMGASGYSDTGRRTGAEWPEPPPWR
jgi:hypothetical protein